MRIGIIGAGQLGRMLALAGYPLGLRFLFVDKDRETPGGQVADLIPGAFDDTDALIKLADATDIITFDVENVPVEAVRAISQRRPFLPPVEALESAQDRLAEKTLFDSLDIPTPEYVALEDRSALEAAANPPGLPAVLKTRRLGYDGRGQQALQWLGDLDEAWTRLGGRPLILESFVDFEREVSLIAVRNAQGALRCYPLSENVHEDGILRYTRAPHVDPPLQSQAESYIRRIMEKLDYVGVLAVEFFVRDGELLANEMAPRVHNSGHWTIEGAVTSQFENHLRAICGLPLGETGALGHAAMVNFLGTMPAAGDILQLPGVSLHCYSKTERPLRKLGHCTAVADDPCREMQRWSNAGVDLSAFRRVERDSPIVHRALRVANRDGLGVQGFRHGR